MNKKLRWTNASLAKALLDDLIQIKIALAKVWVIAKGVLLMGPADAGKILLAQVVAGEAMADIDRPSRHVR